MVVDAEANPSRLLPETKLRMGRIREEILDDVADGRSPSSFLIERT